MPGQKENWYVDITVKVNSDAPNGKQICNTAFIRSIEIGPIETNKPICYTVEVPSRTTPATPATPVGNTPAPNISINITTTITNNITNNVTTPPVPQPGQPNISLNKLVSNLTKGLTNAHNTIAAPGDILQYQVLTFNTGDTASPGYDKLTDNVFDILDYGNIIEISDGGTLKNGLISWKASDIKSKETLTRTFKVQVKNPIPATPRSSSDPQSFDLRMDNTYGNTVSVSLPSPTVARTVEAVTTKTIPNTGPGTTLAIGFGITALIGYFFARSRLLTEELQIVVAEHHSGAL
jgi:hypothetical protein